MVSLSVSIGPCKEALDDPAERPNGETDLTLALLDGFDSNAGGFGDAFVVVAAVGPDVLDEGVERLRHLQQRPASIPILYVGGVRFDKQRPAICINQGMALAVFDLFPGIIARGPPVSVVFTLWLSMLAAVALASRHTLPICHDKSVIDLLEKRAVATARKPAVDCLPGWQIRRQQAPSNAPA